MTIPAANVRSALAKSIVLVHDAYVDGSGWQGEVTVGGKVDTPGPTKLLVHMVSMWRTNRIAAEEVERVN